MLTMYGFYSKNIIAYLLVISWTKKQLMPSQSNIYSKKVNCDITNYCKFNRVILVTLAK